MKLILYLKTLNGYIINEKFNKESIVDFSSLVCYQGGVRTLSNRTSSTLHYNMKKKETVRPY